MKLRKLGVRLAKAPNRVAVAGLGPCCNVLLTTDVRPGGVLLRAKSRPAGDSSHESVLRVAIPHLEGINRTVTLLRRRVSALQNNLSS